MRTKLVAGNWKMHMTVAQAAALVEGVIANVEAKTSVDVVVCPPYLSIPRVKDLTKNSVIKVGAQDVFWKEEGAFTGRVSPKMLSDLCIDYCLVGHSETRGKFGKLEVGESTLGYFAETDETVNLKVRALLFHAITPIICVGETIDERRRGDTEKVIASQISGGLEGLDPAEAFGLVIAYEPVWAIGTGETCAADEANRVCGFIRERIAMTDRDVADNIRILYGGSVKPDNSDELFRQPEIDGGLVGGASLDADGFSRIVLSAR